MINSNIHSRTPVLCQGWLGIVVCALSILFLPRLSSGHDDIIVHPGLTAKSFGLEESGFYTSANKTTVQQGSHDEDHQDILIHWIGFDSWLRHFYDPKTGEGLFFVVRQMSAREYAQDHWQWAMSAYQANPTDNTYNGPFSLLGQTCHLLQDMSSPAHVHLDPHPGWPNGFEGDDFEEWGKTHFPPDWPDGLSPYIPTSRSVQDFVHDLATVAYNLSSFYGGTLPWGGTPSNSELMRMFPSLSWDWTGFWWEIDNVGYYAPDGLNNNDWWPCDGDPGYFYIENTGNAAPAVFEKALKYASFTVGKTLPEIYGAELYPETVRYCAGLLEVFAAQAQSGPTVPSITMTGPSSSITEDIDVAITWNDYDPDSDAQITLWRDNDNYGYNGTVLVTGLSEDANGSFGNYLQPLTGMADGDAFYVYATIDDWHTRRNSTNYTARILVDHPNEYPNAFSFYKEWTERDGNGNGIPEAGEAVQIDIRIQNNTGGEVTNVEGHLSTTNANVVLTDNYDDYGTISAGNTAWGDFRASLNFSSQTNVNFTLYLTFKKNGLSYYQSHSFSKTFYPVGAQGPIIVLRDPPTDMYEDWYPGQANLDGILQSGENISFSLFVKNVGTADAVEVEAKLTDVKGNGVPVNFEMNEGYWENFPDLPVGGPYQKQNSRRFDRVCVPKSFAGTITADVTVRYGDAQIELAPINDVVLFEVQPEAWISVYPENYNFGVVGTDTDVTKTVEIHNVGTKTMTVTAITPSTSDTTWSGPALPFTVPAGGSRTIDIRIETAALDGKTITRSVVMSCDGRVDDVGEDDRIIITGLVSDAVPVYKFPVVGSCFETDVSGDWIVYHGGRYGNDDIFAYQISTASLVRITSDPAAQTEPRISGNLIVWHDRRNNPAESDLYGYDMGNPGLGAFPVSTAPGNERLVGVDGNLVAFIRPYDTVYDNDGNPNTVYNLFVYEYGGNGQFTQKYSTGWTPGSGTTTRQTVDNDGDFGDGLLVFERYTRTWLPQYGYWSMSEGGQWVEVCDFASGETSPHKVFDHFREPYSAASHRFAFKYEYEDPEGYSGDQIWIWENNSMRRLTSPGVDEIDHADDNLAMGGNSVVYDKSSTGESLFFWDLSADQATYPEALLSAELVHPEYCRMDKHTVVMRAFDNLSSSWYIAYAFLGADVSVSSADIQPSVSEPLQDQAFNVVVTVKNISKKGTTQDIQVGLYDGDPVLGASQLGTTQTITGGIPGRGERDVTFPGVSLGEGTHDLVVLCSRIPNENPTNNKASLSMNVADSDVSPPVLSNVHVGEHNGDGDGYIEDNENVVVSWTLADPSGIGETTCSIDDIPRAVTGSYQVVAGPFGVGEHSVVITAVDADSSPEAMDPWTHSFTVYSHAPSVSSVSPINGTTGVERNVAVEATCSGDILDSTVAEGSLEVRDRSGTLVPGALSYSSSEKTIRFLPHDLLSYSTVYTVTLSSGPAGLTDLIGNHLESDYIWTFTTLADVVPPTASIAAPKDNAILVGEASVFGTASDDNFEHYVVEYGAGTSPSSWTEIKNSTSVVAFGELCKWTVLGLDGIYTVRLRVTDKGGNSNQDSVVVEVDNRPPDSPASPYPADGATTISLSATLDWGDCARASSYDVFLWKGTDTRPSQPTATGLLVSFYGPPSNLEYDTVYKWQVIASNVIGVTTGTLWQFTTMPKLPAPEIQPTGHIYNPPIPVTITCGEPGTTITYTTDGSEPTTTSTVCTAVGFKLDGLLGENKTVKAKAFKTGFAPSESSSITYMFREKLSIRGYATLAGVPMSSVTILSETGDYSTTTTADGSYVLTVDCGWSGKLRAWKPGYYFAPHWREYVDLHDLRWVQNFYGSKRTTAEGWELYE